MRFFLTTLLFITLVSAATPAHCQKKFVLSTVENLYEKTVKSVYVKLRAAYKEVGITNMELKRYPGLRSLKFANDGVTDGELVRIKGTETKYPNLIRIPEPILTYKKGYITARKDLVIKDIKGLDKYLVGQIRGVLWQEKLSLDKSLMLDTYEKGINLLVNRRIDILLIGQIGSDEINTAKTKSLHFKTFPGDKIVLYHYINKKHSHLVKKLTRAIRKANIK